MVLDRSNWPPNYFLYGIRLNSPQGCIFAFTEIHLYNNSIRTLLAYAHGHLTRHYSRTTTTCQDRRKPRWNQDPRNSSIRPALSLSKYPRSHLPETLLHSPRKGRQSVRTIRCPVRKAKAGDILDLPLAPSCVTSPPNTKSWSRPQDGYSP